MDIIKINILNMNPHNTKGYIILGSLFAKNGFISHTLPNDNAPYNIRKMSTPHLKKVPRKSVINQFNEGMLP